MNETQARTSGRSPSDGMAITHGIINLFDSWGLRTEEMMALLNLEGKARHFSQYRANKPLPNEPELLRRIEYLVRIDEALRTAYPAQPDIGKRWLRQRSQTFNNQTPLGMMMDEGEQGLIYVLCRLDCTFAWDQSGSSPC